MTDLGRLRPFGPVRGIPVEQMHHTLGASVSGGEPHPPDFLKHPPKWWLG
jgi:hypothetical protein